jgi:hypothetical protein
VNQSPHLCDEDAPQGVGNGGIHADQIKLQVVLLQADDVYGQALCWGKQGEGRKGSGKRSQQAVASSVPPFGQGKLERRGAGKKLLLPIQECAGHLLKAFAVPSVVVAGVASWEI